MLGAVLGFKPVKLVENSAALYVIYTCTYNPERLMAYIMSTVKHAVLFIIVRGVVVLLKYCF